MSNDLLPDFHQLRHKVQIVNSSPEPHKISEVLKSFEELASSNYLTLRDAVKQAEAEPSSDKTDWFQILKNMDASPEHDAAPDRPWTRLYIQQRMGEYYRREVSIPEILNDLRMLNARRRSEYEIDILLSLYLDTIQLYYYDNSSDCPDIIIEFENNRRSIDIYNNATDNTRDYDEEYNIDWDIVDENKIETQNAISEAINIIIDAIIEISDRQWPEICAFNLSNYLLNSNSIDKLRELFIEDYIHDTDFLVTGFRGRMICCINMGSISPEHTQYLDATERNISSIEMDDSEKSLWAQIYYTSHILAKSIHSLRTRGDKEFELLNFKSIHPKLIDSVFMEEIKDAVIFASYTYFISSISNTLYKSSSNIDLSSLEGDLESLFTKYNKIIAIHGIKPEYSITKYDWSTVLFPKLIEFALNALPSITSGSEFRKFIRKPESSMDAESTLTHSQAKDLGWSGNIGIYEYLAANMARLATYDAQEIAQEGQEGDEISLKEFRRLITDISKQPVGEAFEKFNNFERIWLERTREFYRTRGDQTEEKMFLELFAKIGDKRYMKKDQRGQLNGPFGTGCLYYSDLIYFFKMHWNEYYSQYFFDVNALKKVVNILGNMPRNKLCHAQGTEEEQKTESHRMLAHIGDFEKLLKEEFRSFTK